MDSDYIVIEEPSKTEEEEHFQILEQECQNNKNSTTEPTISVRLNDYYVVITRAEA